MTGHRGFVGRRLHQELQRLAYKVRGIDLQDGQNACDWAHIRKFDGFDVLIHLAALTFVPDSFTAPRDFYANNLLSTLNCLELCRLNKARFILAGSYVYGRPRYLPLDEKHPVFAHSPYSQSKLLSEELCRGYHRDFDLEVVILRQFNIYGPGQRADFLIPKLIAELKGHEIVVNDLDPKRDFVHVDDVVKAYVKALNYRSDSCDIFNIGLGTSYSVQEIITHLRELSKTNKPIRTMKSPRKNEIPESRADISKAEKLLGWKPEIGLKKGLARMLFDTGKING